MYFILVFLGIENWQTKLWKLVGTYQQGLETDSAPSDEEALDDAKLKKYVLQVFDARNYFIKEVSFHMDHSFMLSVAISRLQGMTNDLARIPPSYRRHVTGYERTLNDLVSMVSIFAPLFGAELRRMLGKPPMTVSNTSNYR